MRDCARNEAEAGKRGREAERQRVKKKKKAKYEEKKKRFSRARSQRTSTHTTTFRLRGKNKSPSPEQAVSQICTAEDSTPKKKKKIKTRQAQPPTRQTTLKSYLSTMPNLHQRHRLHGSPSTQSEKHSRYALAQGKRQAPDLVRFSLPAVACAASSRQREISMTLRWCPDTDDRSMTMWGKRGSQICFSRSLADCVIDS